MATRKFLGLLAGATAFMAAAPAAAQSNLRYIGQIIIVAGTYCPSGSLEANGQLVSPDLEPGLFSVIGTTYGAQGGKFAVPDLRGRVPIGSSVIGMTGGAESVTLTIDQMARHDHHGNTRAVDELPVTDNPAGATLAKFPKTQLVYNSRPDEAGSSMVRGSLAVGNSGGGQPVDIRSPILAVRFCVMTIGVMP